MEINNYSDSNGNTTSFNAMMINGGGFEGLKDYLCSMSNHILPNFDGNKVSAFVTLYNEIYDAYCKQCSNDSIEPISYSTVEDFKKDLAKINDAINNLNAIRDKYLRSPDMIDLRTGLASCSQVFKDGLDAGRDGYNLYRKLGYDNDNSHKDFAEYYRGDNKNRYEQLKKAIDVFGGKESLQHEYGVYSKHEKLKEKLPKNVVGRVVGDVVPAYFDMYSSIVNSVVYNANLLLETGRVDSQSGIFDISMNDVMRELCENRYIYPHDPARMAYDTFTDCYFSVEKKDNSPENLTVSSEVQLDNFVNSMKVISQIAKSDSRSQGVGIDYSDPRIDILADIHETKSPKGHSNSIPSQGLAGKICRSACEYVYNSRSNSVTASNVRR